MSNPGYVPATSEEIASGFRIVLLSGILMSLNILLQNLIDMWEDTWCMLMQKNNATKSHHFIGYCLIRHSLKNSPVNFGKQQETKVLFTTEHNSRHTTYWANIHRQVYKRLLRTLRKIHAMFSRSSLNATKRKLKREKEKLSPLYISPWPVEKTL